MTVITNSQVLIMGVLVGLVVAFAFFVGLSAGTRIAAQTISAEARKLRASIQRQEADSRG